MPLFFYHVKIALAKLSQNNQRRNLRYNILLEFFFGFGQAFNGISTILPLLLTLLGAPLAIAVDLRFKIKISTHYSFYILQSK